MRFEIQVAGTERLDRVYRQLGAKAPEAAGRALYQFGAYVMHESRATYVPVDTGVLRASGTVQQPTHQGTQTSIVFGYGGAAAPYALAVHENPRAGKTGGISPSGHRYRHWARRGQWKYLETPLKQHAKRLSRFLAASLLRMLNAEGRTARTRGFRFR